MNIAKKGAEPRNLLDILGYFGNKSDILVGLQLRTCFCGSLDCWKEQNIYKYKNRYNPRTSERAGEAVWIDWIEVQIQIQNAGIQIQIQNAAKLQLRTRDWGGLD